MSYRSDVDALTARTEALAAEVAAKTRELDTSQALLDEAIARSKLPVLPNLEVATPCRADWNTMSGDDRVRACGACHKNVYNISALTRDEAEALILEKEGRLCVRYYQRHDGTILLKDCAIGIRQKRKRRVLAVGVTALLGGGVFAAFKLTRPQPKIAPPEVEANVRVHETEPPIEDTTEATIETPPEYRIVLGGIGPDRIETDTPAD